MRIVTIILTAFIFCFANNMESFNIVKEDMQKAINLYKIQNFSNAIENVKFAKHHGYQNTGIKEKIEKEISQEYSQNIENLFFKVIDLMEKKSDVSQINKINDELLKNIENSLSKLSETQETIEEKDWFKVTDKIISNLNEANQMYKKDNIKEAITHIHSTYFDVFEDSGFEKTIMEISVDRKVKAEERFRIVADMIKRSESEENIKKFINQIEDDLYNISMQLSPKKTDYKMFYIIIGFLFTLVFAIIFIKKRKK